MKCVQCGAELESGVRFCRECGHKVEPRKLFCRDCGAELSDGSKFCSNCGSKILNPEDIEFDDMGSDAAPIPGDQEGTDTEGSSNNFNPEKPASRPSVIDESTVPMKQTAGDKLKAKIAEIWRQMCVFSKIATIGSFLVGTLLIIAICTGKVLPIIVSVLQSAGIVVAILAHKGKISLKAQWLKYLILVVAILFSVVNIASYSAGKGREKTPSSNHVSTSQTTSTQNNVASTATETVSTKALLPVGSDGNEGKAYNAVVKLFQDAGFENITVEKVEDLKFDQQDLLDTIVKISIDGNEEFAVGQEVEKGANVKISYHAFAECTIAVNINFVPNLFFSKYDVKFKLDGIEQAILEHGTDGDFEFTLYPGAHTLDFEKKDSSSVNGSVSLDLKGDTNIGLKINCSSDKISVETVFLEDKGTLEDGQVMVSVNASDLKKKDQDDIVETLKSFGFTNFSIEPVYDVSEGSADIGVAAEVAIDGNTDFKRGDIFASDVLVHITYHEDQAKDPAIIAASETAAALEKNLPKEMARRAVIVAMTNCQATDVFASDGNTLDPTKFHSYADIGDFFMTVEKDGEWTALDENTWHVEGILLRIYDYDTYLNASGNIKMVEENYVFYNVDRNITTKENIGSTDPSKTSIDHFEPSDTNSFLTVPASLISEDRDISAAQEKMTAKETRQKWIENQFNWWDGRHEALSELIKDNLNDSKSFKHVDASFIDVYDEDRQKTVNDLLKDAGFKERVEVGDLLILETFTAKNAFNATIKSTGYGIVRSSGSVILLGIE